jgi:transcriptional regulator with XRE-family HTH domain
MNFGEVLAAMREAYGEHIDLPNLRKSAFATLLGVSAIEYEAYERGDRAPTAEFMSVLRRKIGACLDWV